MCRFLCFTVDQAIQGRAADLKEYLLGVEVFDRKQDYDPRVDPIVRVEARRLRAKLQNYYQGEGREDELRIEFPTGGYVPQFVSRVQTAAAGPALEEKLGKTIAVLPFVNLSNQADNEYLSDGLTTELIHALTKAEGLRVVAWTSAAHWKGRNYDLKEIGGQLKADAVLEGSVRRAQDSVRILVQLIDTRTGLYLWSESYNREMRDIFAIQQEIAEAIVTVLKARLTGGVRTSVRREPNIEAYQLYLKGRYHWNQRTAEGFHKSLEYFEDAIAKDEYCALAYAGMADAWSLLVEYGLMGVSEVMPKAKTAALRALELDGTLAEAYTSLAFIRSLFDWEWEEAEGHYRQAISLNPGYASAHHWYSVDYLLLLGRMKEAEAEIQVARLLDPRSLIINEGYGYLMMCCHRYEEAAAYYLELIDTGPEFYRVHTALGRAYGLLGRYDEAIASLLRGRELAGEVPNIAGALGQIYAMAGREKEARGELRRLKEMATRRVVSAVPAAFIYMGLGEKAKALDCLEAACERRETPLSGVNVHPAYDSLRGEARFQAILRRMGFLEGSRR